MGCEALIDAWNGEVDIERVCAHSSFSRRDFARVIVKECSVWLRDMGLRKATITGYSEAATGLYASLGASKEVYDLVLQISNENPCYSLWRW